MSAPVNGVIVHWSVKWGMTPASVALQVLRPVGSGALFFSGTDAATITTPTNSFGASLPISIGDRIAVEELAGPNTSPRGRTATGAVIETWTDTPATGTSAPPAVSNNPANTELLLNAEIEPTNDATVGKIRRNKRKGTATLTASTPNPGTLQITKGPIRPQTIKVAQPGEVRATLRPSKRARKRLRRSGTAAGRIELIFTPNFGTPSRDTAKLVLRLNR